MLRWLGSRIVIATSLAAFLPGGAILAGPPPAGDARVTPLSPQPSQGPAAFEWEIKQFEAQDKSLRTRPPRVVFIGSSSIKMWEGLEKDFPHHRVVNRGFGGSHVVDSVYYADRILPPHKPTLIIMYAGSNDINAGKRADTVAADFKSFTEKVWSTMPQTTIAFISIATSPSRWSQVATVREANRLIAAYCASDARLKFIDIFPLMLGADGRPQPELFIQDGLHMNRKGYELWIPLVRNVLDTAVPAKPESAPAGRHAKH